VSHPRAPQNRTFMQKRCCYAFGGIRKRDPLWNAATWSDCHFWALLTTIDSCEWRTWRKKSFTGSKREGQWYCYRI